MYKETGQQPMRHQGDEGGDQKRELVCNQQGGKSAKQQNTQIARREAHGKLLHLTLRLGLYIGVGVDKRGGEGAT